jgi:biopolymer transport protein ExbB
MIYAARTADFVGAGIGCDNPHSRTVKLVIAYLQLRFAFPALPSRTTDCLMRSYRHYQSLILAAVVTAGLTLPWTPLLAQGVTNVVEVEVPSSPLELSELVRAGGAIGYLIGVLSLIMVALIIDHLLNIRRSTLMPPGLAEEVHRRLGEQDIVGAKQVCDEHPGFLSRLLYAGLDEVGVGYASIEKSMEDAAVEQSARLFRRIEYLSVIGTIVPMLGLMGTVWGMIQAFVEFEQKANPQVSELAPGIYRALVTTLLGLGVAVPSLSAFAIFRNRIDELAAEATLLAEHVFADFRRAIQKKSVRRPRTDVSNKPSTELPN